MKKIEMVVGQVVKSSNVGRVQTEVTFASIDSLEHCKIISPGNYAIELGDRYTLTLEAVR
jgi:hypothetical protein